LTNYRDILRPYDLEAEAVAPLTFAGENSRTISEPPKIIPVCIQYDTTDLRPYDLEAEAIASVKKK
jgi:hypothetical protein